MAPSTVRTIPPWVVQRPPQTLLPLHNSTPSDPRHGRGASRDGQKRARSSRGTESDKTDPDLGNNGNGDGTVDGSGSDQPSSGPSATVPGSASSQPPPTGSSATTRTTTGPRTPSPPPEFVPNEPPPSGWRFDLNTLFRKKEGRKWDYLRSDEPVIVPQFHVVNRPVRDEEEYIGSDAAPGGGSRRAGNNSSFDAGRRTDQQPSWWYNPGTQWRAFIDSTRYRHPRGERSEVVPESALDSNFGYRFFLNPRPGLGTASAHSRHHTLGGLVRRGGGGGGGGAGGNDGHGNSTGGDGTGSGSDSRDGLGSNKKHKYLYQRVWRTLLHHPLGPLACRLTVLSTSIVALAVAITIFRHEHLGGLDRGNGYLSRISRVAALDLLQERAQIIVAIVVDVVAVPYIGYITVDDYTGKPLGLRPPQDRIRLILLDLFFIILKSASTALGFEAMIYFVSDNGGNNDAGLMRTLAAFELMGLVSWAMTLTINIFREIERLGGR